MVASTIGIVPMRHHSQRVEGKNYRLLGNKPLYHYIIETLLKNECMIDLILIDTDSDTIINGIIDFFGQNDRIIISRRPTEICQPGVSMNTIIKHCLSRNKQFWDENTIFFQTHCTNPFLDSESVYQSLKIFKTGKYDSIMSVNLFQKRLWTTNGTALNHNPGKLIQTQDLDLLFEENSCFYIFNSNTFLTYNNRIGNKCFFYEMSNKLESWDIDNEEDFEIALIILQYLKENKDEFIRDHFKELTKLDNKVVIEVNTELLELLNTELKSEINEFIMQKNNEDSKKSYQVLISAPYMMKDIITFQKFLENIGIKVIVAHVEERLSASDLERYHGLYNVAIIGDDQFNAEVLKKSGCQALCKWGTGIDSIDQDCCRELGIKVYNTPNAFSVPVAQSILGAILGFIRSSFESNNLMKNTNQWVKIPGYTLSEITVGVIGLGNLGTQLCHYLDNMGCQNILGYDILETAGQNIRNINRKDNAEDVIRNADVLCLCCTLTPSSFHLMNAERIGMMKAGSYLINHARGPIVQEKALVDALENGHLRGASLDVFEIEPLPEDSMLRKLDNVHISSHNSNSSPHYWNKVHINTLRNTLRAL